MRTGLREARGTLPPEIVGVAVGPLRHVVDARWLMAYSAALGETDSRYFDTLTSAGPLAHPLFPVCYEWPAAVALRERTIPAELQPQGVHATHHLVIHRPPRAGDSLRTTARVTEVAPRRSGTLVLMRFETVEAGGQPVSTTEYGSIYRDVVLAADGGPVDPAANAASTDGHATAGDAAWHERVDVPANAAHVYTECARIWNPIHTDVAVARRAGLPAPILHGSATLALAVSRVVARELGGDPGRAGEIRARFSGMVGLPSSFTVRGRRADPGRIVFDAIAADGARVLSQGLVVPCDR
jgi:acyl dehydratase